MSRLEEKLRNTPKLLQATILCVFLCCTMSLSACARHVAVLRADQRILIIPRGQQFRAIWDGKLQEWVADDELAVMYKGQLLKLQEEANDAVR